MNLLRITKISIHLLLILIIILFIVTGFGITNFRIIESLTLGLLSKPVSYQLHTSLIIPFIILLTLHIVLSLSKKIQKQNRK
jgi:hypothetical protein